MCHFLPHTLTPLVSTPHYHACTRLAPPAPMVLHGEPEWCFCPAVGRETVRRVMASYNSALAGSAVSLSRSIWGRKKKVERRKEGICFPQATSASMHYRSNLPEEGFSVICLKHKLTLLYYQKEQEIHSK